MKIFWGSQGGAPSSPLSPTLPIPCSLPSLTISKAKHLALTGLPLQIPSRAHPASQVPIKVFIIPPSSHTPNKNSSLLPRNPGVSFHLYTFSVFNPWIEIITGQDLLTRGLQLPSYLPISAFRRVKADVSWGGETFLPLNACPLSPYLNAYMHQVLFSVFYRISLNLQSSLRR